GDIAGGVAHFAPDFRCVEPDSLPYAGSYRGPEGFTRLMALIADTWREFSFTVDDILADGELVVVIATMNGVVGGQPLTMRVMERWILRDGQALEISPHYFDTKKIADLTKPA